MSFSDFGEDWWLKWGLGWHPNDAKTCNTKHLAWSRKQMSLRVGFLLSKRSLIGCRNSHLRDHSIVEQSAWMWCKASLFAMSSTHHHPLSGSAFTTHFEQPCGFCIVCLGSAITISETQMPLSWTMKSCWSISATPVSETTWSRAEEKFPSKKAAFSLINYFSRPTLDLRVPPSPLFWPDGYWRKSRQHKRVSQF